MSDTARVDITINQGADFAMQMYWTDNNDIPFRVVHPIRMEVRDSVSRIILTFVSGTEEGELEDHSLTFNTELGLIQITANADATDALTPGVYFYDLFATYEDRVTTQDSEVPMSTVRRMKVIEGTVQVNGRITQNV